MYFTPEIGNNDIIFKHSRYSICKNIDNKQP